MGRITSMTNELEKTFFDTFGIGKPKLKVWRYSGYYEDYSWDSELIDCAELLERNNWTIEELNERIQTSKQEEKEKNSELYDYRFDSIETEFGKTTKAFVEYPKITDRILLELICIANREDVYIELVGTDVETMKNNLLENFIHFKRIVPKQQIQKLFEE